MKSTKKGKAKPSEGKCPKCSSINTAVPNPGERCCFDCGYVWHPCPKCGREMTAILLPQRWMAGGNKPDAYECPECGHEEKVKELNFVPPEEYEKREKRLTKILVKEGTK